MPAASLQLCWAGITRRHGRFKIWWCDQQGALDAVNPWAVCRPMGHHHTTSTVGHEHDRLLDAGDGIVDGLDPPLARQVLSAHGRHHVCARHVLRQKGLPVLVDMVPQTGDEQQSHGSHDGGAAKPGPAAAFRRPCEESPGCPRCDWARSHWQPRIPRPCRRRPRS